MCCMAANEVTVHLVDGEAYRALVDLLERMEDGDLWSVPLAAEQLREIVEDLHRRMGCG